jgi:Ca-activated chloride channel family protein
MRRVRVAAVVLAAASVAWLDPHAPAREGNRHYAEGRYEDAVGKYNEALVDDPDSPLLRFNLGVATYQTKKWADAAKAFEQVPTSDADAARAARVAYNLGNARYRLGEEAAASDPLSALRLWGEALVAYRRALGAEPDDVDAKFNHEFVERKIAELRKKLEEEQQQREQQEQEQGQRQDKDQDQAPDQAQEGAPQEEPQPEPSQDQPKDAGQPSPSPHGEAPPPSEAAAGEATEREMSPQEAAALLDAQREDELEPRDLARRLQPAVPVEPAEDW